MPSSASVLRLYGPAVVCSLAALCGVPHGLGAPLMDDCADAAPARPARVAPTMTRMMTLFEIERLSKEKGLAMCFVENPTQQQLDEIAKALQGFYRFFERHGDVANQLRAFRSGLHLA